MESSPLAAMHQGSAWGTASSIFGHGHYTTTSSAHSSVGLREQLHKNAADYFNVKNIRGCSPAASLAADISQNFRLDNEARPQFPTPRRALFTSMGNLDTTCRQYVTTPPIASSSPLSAMELMELSPLPHKAPFFNQIEITSPTPIASPDDEMMLDSPAPIPRQAMLEPPKPVVAERKIAAPRRPSLTRMKGLTTTSLPTRPHADSVLPTFRFGSETALSVKTANLSPGECFEANSPPQQRRPQSANSPSAPVPLSFRVRPQLTCLNGSSRHVSLSAGHTRRQSNPFMRTRKQMRRSLSMFEHPGDVMKPKPEDDDSPTSSLQSVMDVEECNSPKLPHFMTDDPSDTIPRLTKQTMLDVMDGKYAEHFDQKMVIDCRFEYEYDGGHIDGAVNYNDKELLASQLFKTPMSGRTLLIFHCEYSAHRAPLMARHVRSEDRTTNAEYYPRLTYPEVYILDGGYSGFFAEHRGRCYPQEYVEMSDAKHQRTCEREMGRLKARKGLGRSQTFAFGQRESFVDASPTAPARPSSRNTTLGSYGYSPAPSDRAPFTRRMPSY